MAHIEVTTTGFKVITHVRGRVYRQQPQKPRPDQSLHARLKPHAVKRRTVCVLNATSAEQLESFGINQPCHGDGCNHAHHTRARIQALIKTGELRWIGKGENVATWKDARSWKGVKSMGYQVMQLVEP